jgi:hypothetical protein
VRQIRYLMSAPFPWLTPAVVLKVWVKQQGVTDPNLAVSPPPHTPLRSGVSKSLGRFSWVPTLTRRPNLCSHLQYKPLLESMCPGPRLIRLQASGIITPHHKPLIHASTWPVWARFELKFRNAIRIGLVRYPTVGRWP